MAFLSKWSPCSWVTMTTSALEFGRVISGLAVSAYGIYVDGAAPVAQRQRAMLDEGDGNRQAPAGEEGLDGVCGRGLPCGGPGKITSLKVADGVAGIRKRFGGLGAAASAPAIDGKGRLLGVSGLNLLQEAGGFPVDVGRPGKVPCSVFLRSADVDNGHLRFGGCGLEFSHGLIGNAPAGTAQERQEGCK